MAYGKRYRTDTSYSAKRRRTTGSGRAKTYRRQVGFAKARSNPRRTIARNYVRTKRNTSLIKANYRLAKKALATAYGPLQRQIQQLTVKLHPTQTHPVAFDAWDLAAGDSKHCQIWSPASTVGDNRATPITAFGVHNNHADPTHNFWENSETHQLNGPVHKAFYVSYDLCFDAKVDDVHVCIHFIRPKSTFNKDPHLQMPNALVGLQRLADCPKTNFVNPDYFTQWRKPINLYFNSRGTYQSTSALSAVVDAASGIALDEDNPAAAFTREFPASTPFRKRIRLYVKINKEIAEMHPGLRESSTTKDLSLEGQHEDSAYLTAGMSKSGPWFKKNADQRWVVISSDDSSANPLLSDRVQLSVSRMCVWRDKLA